MRGVEGKVVVALLHASEAMRRTLVVLVVLAGAGVLAVAVG
jgi:hypothetical protein